MPFGWRPKTQWLTRWTTTAASHGRQLKILLIAPKTLIKGETSTSFLFSLKFSTVIFSICSSVSLTSLDSEEQESLRANERLHNRTNRNSTGGISTHSLNEAELAVIWNFLHFPDRNSIFTSKLFSSFQRDFEKLNAKRNLAPTICRIPLQKSISTPSIAPVQNAKEENNVPWVKRINLAP